MRPIPLLALLTLIGACAGVTVQSAAQPGAPAAQSKAAAGGMISAANPLAVEAGLKVLRQGGSAIDAAIAVQAVLGLVEPQSSGLAGGAYMTYYDARTKQVTAYDGRETAPASAGPDYFLKADGAPLGPAAIRTGKSTGAPGALAMLAMAHTDHGKLPWGGLFTEAERMARDGFPVPSRMAAAAGRAGPDIVAYVKGAKAGDTLTNVPYADTVHMIAQQGVRWFYEGPPAAAIAAKVAEAPTPGGLTAADIAAYRPKKSEALCRPYRVYIVCVPQAPSGGVGVLMALEIYENTAVAEGGPASPQAWYLFAEGQRLMYADRDQYVGDPAFVQVPVAGLLDPAYVRGRAAMIGARSQAYTPGRPPGAVAMGPDATNEVPGTSHFVVVDGAGNVVSMTTTVESSFGSNRMAMGMVLNNQLTDFSQAPRDATGALVANSVAAGKRPRSSMAPVIVLDRNRNFVLAVGSPGGNSIPAFNLKVLVGFLDWHLPLQEAVNLPNVIARGPGTQAETDRFSPGVVDGLTARGIDVRGAGGEGSGLHAVALVGGRLVGAADPRREGVALAP